VISRVDEEAKDLREFLDQLRAEPGYWKHFTILQFTTSMARLMKKSSPRVSGKKLAELRGVKPSSVSRALSGGENLSIETMTEMAGVLDAAVHIHVAKKGVVVRWKEETIEDPMPEAFLSMAFVQGPFHGSVPDSQTEDFAFTNPLLFRVERGADVHATGPC
jgi:transcriptional regulator with XRE-family HTH domain